MFLKSITDNASVIYTIPKNTNALKYVIETFLYPVKKMHMSMVYMYNQLLGLQVKWKFTVIYLFFGMVKVNLT